MPEDLIGQLVENRKDEDGFIESRVLAMAYDVPDTSRAFKSGLRRFDIIKKVDSTPITYFDELRNILITRKNTPILLTISRNGQDEILHVTPNNEGRIGFGQVRDPEILDSLGWIKFSVTKYSFIAAFPAGVKKHGKT